MFSYVGNGIADEFGAAVSRMPKFSVWLDAMSTTRGLLQNEVPA